MYQPSKVAQAWVLAIVKKIMEDHGGGFMAQNQPSGGACIRLTFPAYAEHSSEIEPGQLSDKPEK